MLINPYAHDGGGESPPVLWTPSELSTELWLDAADAATITIATGVSVWADKSGNGRDVSQATAAFQPALISASQNGLDVVRFDGVNDALLFSAGYSQVSGQNIFLTGDTTSLGAGNRWLMNRNNGNAPGIYLGALGQDYKPTVQWDGQQAVFGSAIQRAALFRWSFASGTPASALTQIDAGTPVMNTFTASALSTWFGIGFSPNQQPAFDAFEIVILPPGASADDIDRIHGYLAWKWGLETVLPIGHPYKDSPP